MKRCPTCSSLLSRRRIGSLEIDGCAGCGGIFLDDGELSRLNREDPTSLRRVSDSVRATQPPLKAERTGLCPKCGQTLTAFEYPQFPGIRLDGCPGCKGVWCEAGELAALGDRIVPPAAPSPVAASADGGVHVGAASMGGVRAAGRPNAAPVWGSEAAVRGSANVDDPTSTAGLPLVRGVTLSHHHPMGAGGFFGSVQRGWRFISGAYALAFQEKSLLTPMLAGMALGLVFNAVALGLMFAWWSATGGPAAPSYESWAHAHPAGLTVAVLLWALCAQILGYFTMGMTVSMIDAYLKGREPSLGVAFQDSLKNIGGIVALAVVDTLVNVLVSALKGNRRERGLNIGAMVLSAIGSAIEAAWTVLSFLLLPVIIIEDVGLGTALSRVRAIHEGNLMQIGVGEIGIRAVAGVIGFVFLLLMVPLAMVLLPIKGFGLVLFVVLLVIGLTIVGTLNSFAKAAYYTSLYLWASERERTSDPSQVMVPGLLASAMR